MKNFLVWLELIFLIGFNFSCNLNKSQETLPKIQKEENKVRKLVGSIYVDQQEKCWQIQHLQTRFEPSELAQYLNLLISQRPSSTLEEAWKWENQVDACLRLMRQFPSCEYKQILLKVIYNTDWGVESQRLLELYQGLAIKALAATGCSVKEMWSLLSIEKDYLRGIVIDSLALELALDSNDNHLKLLIEKAEEIHKAKPLAGYSYLAQQYVQNLVGLREMLARESFFQQRLVTLFENIAFEVGPLRCISDNCLTQYGLVEFSSLLVANPESGIQVLRDYTNGTDRKRLIFLRLVKDLNLPIQLTSEEERTLKEMFQGSLENWPPLTIPGVSIYNPTQPEK